MHVYLKNNQPSQKLRSERMESKEFDRHSRKCPIHNKWAPTRENLHPSRQISAIDIRFVESIISKLDTGKI